jgi:hypothetical protein
MRIVNVALAASAVAAIAVSAVAAPARLSDADYIAANRCLGLMTSTGFASPDAKALGAYVRDQGLSRIAYVWDKGNQVRDDAKREGNASTPQTDPGLLAERDGVCHTFVAYATTTAEMTTGHGAHSM